MSKHSILIVERVTSVFDSLLHVSFHIITAFWLFVWSTAFWFSFFFLLRTNSTYLSWFWFLWNQNRARYIWALYLWCPWILMLGWIFWYLWILTWGLMLLNAAFNLILFLRFWSSECLPAPILEHTLKSKSRFFLQLFNFFLLFLEFFFNQLHLGIAVFFHLSDAVFHRLFVFFVLNLQFPIQLLNCSCNFLRNKFFPYLKDHFNDVS